MSWGSNKPAPKKCEAATFKVVWICTNRKSFLSGLDLMPFLGTPLHISCFAHVLSKNKYPNFRCYLGNIWLLTPVEHKIYDHGTLQDRETYSKTVKTADWSKLEEKEIELKKLYDLYFPKKTGLILNKYLPWDVENITKDLNHIFLDELKRKGS